MRRKWAFVPLAILGVAAFALVGAVIVMLLWNWLLPALFGLPPVTIWQALGLLILSRVLFGGFGRGHGRYTSRMNDEERERIRRRLRERFGFRGPAGDTGTQL